MPLVPADQVGAEETYVGAVELPKAPSASQPVDSAQAQALDQWWAGWRAGRLVAKIAIPTLVADGAADHLDPVANAHLLARLIPGATLKLYADASGAFMFQEYPAYPGRARRAVMGPNPPGCRSHVPSPASWSTALVMPRTPGAPSETK